MFDGRDYHRAFEKAIDNLTGKVLDRDDTLGQLVSLEWTLWEAIRGPVIVTRNMMAMIIIIPAAYLFRDSGWVGGVVLVVAYFVLIVGLYWLFRFAAYWEISRHVKGRRFGDHDLPWLPSGTGYSERKSD
jgi:hypothetical protein